MVSKIIEIRIINNMVSKITETRIYMVSKITGIRIIYMVSKITEIRIIYMVGKITEIGLISHGQ